MGHVISSQGVEIDNTKVECMLKWQVPTTVKVLRVS